VEKQLYILRQASTAVPVYIVGRASTPVSGVLTVLSYFVVFQVWHRHPRPCAPVWTFAAALKPCKDPDVPAGGDARATLKPPLSKSPQANACHRPDFAEPLFQVLMSQREAPKSADPMRGTVLLKTAEP
jgi:hypothetical protein